jgi:2-oxoglutarate ferredoxin oxidoreductase subunit alpha
MVPTFLLSDGYIANGAEPWLIPDLSKLPKINIIHPTSPNSGDSGKTHENGAGEPGKFLPYKRNENLVRPWALPGTPGLEHRIGGIEKQDVTGNINYEPGNHEHMIHTRAQKVANIAKTIPDLVVEGDQEGELLLIGWGGTYGSIATAVQRARRNGWKVGHVHFQYLNPFPKNTGEVFKKFKHFLVPELNAGQLLLLLRGMYLIDAKGLNKIQGRPFLVSEILDAIKPFFA